MFRILKYFLRMYTLARKHELRIQAVLRIRDVYPGSRILIFNPSWILRISDPVSQNSNNREGWKKFVIIPFFVAKNFTKFIIILVLKCLRKKLGSIFKELYNFLPKKLSLSSQKYGFGILDPRSGIRDPEKTYSGSRIQGSKRHRIPDPGSGSATLDPGG